jgi:uncharacterized damage-inducible protein DinB
VGKKRGIGTGEKILDFRFLFAYDSAASKIPSAKEITPMTIGQSMLGEFDQEMAGTRKTLERLPEQKWNWKPHDKSGTVGWLAGHIATMPGWITMTLQTEQLDYAPVGGPAYEPPKMENRQQILAEFDKSVTEARKAIADASDADMMKDWTLLAGGQTIFTMPRAACLRSMIFNHIIHHRAQLTVYYRLLGVPVPGLYGPSADETQPAADAATN